MSLMLFATDPAETTRVVQAAVPGPTTDYRITQLPPSPTKRLSFAGSQRSGKWPA
jgi:hypothetical protein